MDRTAVSMVVWASLASPAGFLTANATRAPSLTRIFFVALGTFVAGLAMLWSTTRFKGDVLGRAPAVSLGIVTLTYFGLVEQYLADMTASTFLGLGTLTAIAISLSTLMLIHRQAIFADMILFALAGSVVAPLALMALGSSRALGIADQTAPDVVVVFLDGYAGSETLDSRFGAESSSFVSGLSDRGFHVDSSATASYSMTYASIASILEMDYVVESGFIPDERLRPDLYRRMQGDNAFVHTFKDAGYKYVHIESGWGGTRCGVEVEICIGAPILEETLWNLLQRTAIGPIMRQLYGHSFPVNGLDRLHQLGTIELDPTKPELVIVHILLPHPPLFVNANCLVAYSADLDGMNVGAPSFGDSQNSRRRDAYLDQVECVNSAVLSALDSPTFINAVIAVIGDHGTDSQGQLRTPVTEWTEDMVAERFETIHAVKGCAGTVPNPTINSLRYVTSCVLGIEYVELPLRQFLVPVVENHPTDNILELGG